MQTTRMAIRDHSPLNWIPWDVPQINMLLNETTSIEPLLWSFPIAECFIIIHSSRCLRPSRSNLAVVLSPELSMLISRNPEMKCRPTNRPNACRWESLDEALPNHSTWRRFQSRRVADSGMHCLCNRRPMPSKRCLAMRASAYAARAHSGNTISARPSAFQCIRYRCSKYTTKAYEVASHNWPDIRDASSHMWINNILDTLKSIPIIE